MNRATLPPAGLLALSVIIFFRSRIGRRRDPAPGWPGGLRDSRFGPSTSTPTAPPRPTRIAPRSRPPSRSKYGGTWTVYTWNPQSRTASEMYGSGANVTGPLTTADDVRAEAERLIAATPGAFKADLAGLRFKRGDERAAGDRLPGRHPPRRASGPPTSSRSITASTSSAATST